MKGNMWPQWAEPVLAFFAGKKLLIVPHIEARPSQIITLAAALRVGNELEPRVIEVLPAAIIHFPKNFTHLQKMPKDLQSVIKAIVSDREDGPSLNGIAFENMKRWANIELADKRVVPARKKRRMRSFRFSPEAIYFLKKCAKERRLSETELLETWILDKS